MKIEIYETPVNETPVYKRTYKVSMLSDIEELAKSKASLK